MASGRRRRDFSEQSLDDSVLQDNLLEDLDTKFASVTVTKPTPKTADVPAQRITREKVDDGNQRLVIAIDFGTTFTGVAYATAQSETARLDRITSVSNWGQDQKSQLKVPSVISYSPATKGEQQWGNSISADGVTMLNTKLELEVQDNKIDELELTIQVLEGTGYLSFDNVKKSGNYPAYTWKSPEEIVTDYLSRVFEACYPQFEKYQRIGVQSGERIVDIVVTVPVKWSYRAKNSTLRAIIKAGFNKESFPGLNDIILVTEPEAASVFTARHLKEEQSMEFLKLGECFVLCDAGGGTVDVISYQVTQLAPHLELEQVSIATSDKCGAAYINGNFKKWLHRTIGDKNYRELDPRTSSQRIGSHTMEGGQLRALMGQFEARKKAFDNNTPPVRVDLAAPLNRLNIPNKVREGELTITPDDMRWMFDPCVNKVVELIQGQVQQIERKHRRCKNVFLVGGFGESPYLQEELRKSLEMRRIRLRRPTLDNSWTAVVKGAVMYGIEKARYKNVRKMTTAARSYAIVTNEVQSVYKFDQRDRYVDVLTNSVMARKQLSWMVRKGDLILSDEPKVEEKDFTFTFKASDSRRFDLPIYEYPDPDDDVPDRWETGQNEISEIGVVECDLSHFSLDDFEQRQNHNTRQIYYIAYLVCRMSLSMKSLEVEVLLNNRRVGYEEIGPGEEIPARESFESWD